MKTEWADLFGVYDCEDDDSLMVKKRIQVRLTHVFNGCETTSYVDFDERHIDDFLAENEAKLVPENEVSVEPDEYARMKDLARMYADQVERANREAARANYAEFMLGLALDEGLKAARVGNLVKQCIDGGYDLEISEARTTIGRVGYKVRVDPATRTVLKAGIFDAIEEMLKEVRRG